MENKKLIEKLEKHININEGYIPGDAYFFITPRDEEKVKKELNKNNIEYNWIEDNSYYSRHYSKEIEFCSKKDSDNAEKLFKKLNIDYERGSNEDQHD